MGALWVLAVGCAPGVVEFIPHEDEPAPVLPGLASFLDDASIDGRKLHVVFVHGMGHGEPPPIDESEEDEAVAEEGPEHPCGLTGVPETYWPTLEDSAIPILERLGVSAPEFAVQCHDPVGGVRAFSTMPLDIGPERTIVFHELNYAAFFGFEGDGTSPYPEDTTPYAYVDDDKMRLIENDRALLDGATRLNTLLKSGLITWGFSDAVTYLDPMKRGAILAAMSEALALALDEDDGYVLGDHTVFVTRSLGSKVLFDLLAHMYGFEHERAPLVSSEESVVLPNTRAVYMFANQLPLLELGTAVDRPQLSGDETVQNVSWYHLFLDDDFEAVLPQLSEDRQLYVVAFSDPNDPLTFRIAPTIRHYVPRSGPNAANYELVAADFRVPIGRNYVGLFVDPVGAHTGHIDHPGVLSIMVDGWAETPSNGGPP